MPGSRIVCAAIGAPRRPSRPAVRSPIRAWGRRSRRGAAISKPRASRWRTRPRPSAGRGAISSPAGTSERECRDEGVAPGQWRASGEVDVIAPGAAIVQSVEVRVGDEVKPGATVAWLESRESAAALQGARLMLEQAHDEASRAEA